MKIFLLILVVSIPLNLLAQDRTPDGLYSTTSYRALDSKPKDSSNRLVVSGANPAGIKVSASVDRFAFPKPSMLSVYPNPAVADTRAVFSSNENGIKYYLSMISLEGKQLLQKSGSTVKGTNVINLDMSSYPMGSYFLQLFVGNRKETAQFLKVLR